MNLIKKKFPLEVARNYQNSTHKINDVELGWKSGKSVSTNLALELMTINMLSLFLIYFS